MIRDMTLYQSLAILLLALSVSAAFTNTTEFWRNTLNKKFIHYQSYSGTHLSTKATNK